MSDIDFDGVGDIPLQTDTEISVKKQIEEWMGGDPIYVSKKIILESIVDECIGYAGKKRNLQGIAALLKLYMSMSGVEQASQQDINIDVSNVKSADELMDLFLKERAGSNMKSEQFKDLINGVKVKTDYVRAPAIEALVKEVEELKGEFRAKAEFKIRSREEVSNDDQKTS